MVYEWRLANRRLTREASLPPLRSWSWAFRWRMACAALLFTVGSAGDAASQQPLLINPPNDADQDSSFPPPLTGPTVTEAEPVESLDLPLVVIDEADEFEVDSFLRGTWRRLNDDEEAEGPAAGDPPGPASPTTNITVELQSDFVWSAQDQANKDALADPPNNPTGEIGDGAMFRRSRLGVYGELYETVEYRLEYDFHGDDSGALRPRFLDNWIAATNIPIVRNLIVGHYFEPFSLERYTPNRFITFNERSLADTFAPKRNTGAMMYGNALDQRLTFALGAFRSNSDNFGEDVSINSGYAMTAHATLLAWYEELNDDNLSLLHLGGSFSYRLPGDEPVRFAARPSVRLRQLGNPNSIPFFVDTDDMFDAKHTYLIGLESAWVYGPFSVQSELIGAHISRRQNDSPLFHAGYIYGSWFLTGESRSYSPTSVLGRFREGIFQRITPRTAVFDRTQGSGWTGGGAWEVAVRWSYIDLNAAGVQGGHLEEMTYGVNWFFNRYTKMQFNYVRPNLEQDPSLARTAADFFSVRMQFEY